MAGSLSAASADLSARAPSSATSAAAAAPSTSAPAKSMPTSAKRSATEKPAGMGTAAVLSQMPSEPTLHRQSNTAADACRDTASGSGLSQAADGQAGSDRASERASDRASDRDSDRGSGRASDRASHKASERASDRASDKASGTQVPWPAVTAAAQQASEQQPSALPGVVPDGAAQVQQAGTDKAQQASMHAALPDAQPQPVPTKATLGQIGGSEPPIRNSVRMNGQAPPCLPRAHANGTAASMAATQGPSLSKEPHAASQAAVSRDQQLQAAALGGTAASSQAAVHAGLSLPTPRSGTEQHRLFTGHLACVHVQANGYLSTVKLCKMFHLLLVLWVIQQMQAKREHQPSHTNQQADRHPATSDLKASVCPFSWCLGRHSVCVVVS